MITVVTCRNLEEAGVLCSLLEHEGISAFIPDEYAVLTQPLLSNAIGGVRIQVKPQDEQRSKEIINGIGIPPRIPIRSPRVQTVSPS